MFNKYSKIANILDDINNDINVHNNDYEQFYKVFNRNREIVLFDKFCQIYEYNQQLPTVDYDKIESKKENDKYLQILISNNINKEYIDKCNQNNKLIFGKQFHEIMKYNTNMYIDLYDNLNNTNICELIPLINNNYLHTIYFNSNDKYIDINDISNMLNILSKNDIDIIYKSNILFTIINFLNTNIYIDIKDIISLFGNIHNKQLRYNLIDIFVYLFIHDIINIKYLRKYHILKEYMESINFYKLIKQYKQQPLYYLNTFYKTINYLHELLYNEQPLNILTTDTIIDLYIVLCNPNITEQNINIIYKYENGKTLCRLWNKDIYPISTIRLLHKYKPYEEIKNISLMELYNKYTQKICNLNKQNNYKKRYKINEIPGITNIEINIFNVYTKINSYIDYNNITNNTIILKEKIDLGVEIYIYPYIDEQIIKHIIDYIKLTNNIHILNNCRMSLRTISNNNDIIEIYNNIIELFDIVNNQYIITKFVFDNANCLFINVCKLDTNKINKIFTYLNIQQHDINELYNLYDRNNIKHKLCDKNNIDYYNSKRINISDILTKNILSESEYNELLNNSNFIDLLKQVYNNWPYATKHEFVYNLQFNIIIELLKMNFINVRDALYNKNFHIDV